MLEASQNWNLFGYDLRNSVYYVRAGWKDFLWGDGSPVMESLDEVVRVYGEEPSPSFYRAGGEITEPTDPAVIKSEAILLPDRLVLPKKLVLPLLAEGNLETVVGLEVRSNSPFPADDTRFAWRVVERNEKTIQVQLIICSCGAVMEYMAGLRDCHDLHTYEIWSRIDGNILVVEGFGEGARKGRNKKKLVRLGLGIVYCLLVLVLGFGLSAGLKFLELEKVREQQQTSRASAAKAVSSRSVLSSAKSRVAVVNDIIARNPSPYLELSRLSALLDDDTWLSQVEMNGVKIRIDGTSPDAAAVMQNLTDQPAYDSVVAPVGIKRVNSTGMERFVLDLTLVSASENP